MYVIVIHHLKRKENEQRTNSDLENICSSQLDLPDSKQVLKQSCFLHFIN